MQYTVKIHTCGTELITENLRKETPLQTRYVIVICKFSSLLVLFVTFPLYIKLFDIFVHSDFYEINEAKT
jgi:hypothetical protein